MYLAQFNVARIKYPLTDPRMWEFVDNVNKIHRVADRIGGLIYRLKDDSGTAMNMTVMNDPMILPNLTIWKNVDSLKRFLDKTVHKFFFNKGSEWFDVWDKSKNCMWYCAESYRPKEMFDGELRMCYMWEHGSTDYAFDWKYLQLAGLAQR